MARTRVIQNSLIAGVIAPTLLGRIDLKKYYSAVEEAENVTILPHGGMERRPGLKLLDDVTVGSRLFSFEFSITQNYVIVLNTANFKVYLPESGTIQATIPWSTPLTTTQLNDMDIIQNADTIIITHEDFNPIQIQRQGSHTAWAVSDIELTNIPKFDYDTTKIPTYFNYGDSLIFDIDKDEIVYNNTKNIFIGANEHLYKAIRDVLDTDLSLIDFTKEIGDYTNYGTPSTQTVEIGEVVNNLDEDDVNGHNTHVYRAITQRVSIDLSTEDYLDADNWMDNGFWSDEGIRPNVWGITNDNINYTNEGPGTSIIPILYYGDQVLNDDGNDVNGLDNHVYKCNTVLTLVDLSTTDFSDRSKWTNLGEYSTEDKGYPRTCTFHQGRLWFGGSKSKPTSVWGSVINDFFNFDTGESDVLADDAIFDILDTDQFNAIQNIVSSRNLQVMTAGGEFVNTEEILTPMSSAWTRSTGYGSSRIKPVTLDGATYFMDRFRKTVRGFIYDYDDAGYSSPPISILAEHIINDVQDLDIVRGSSISVSNLLYLVNGDGTVAVFNTMRKEDIAGWTQWTTQGEFKRVIVSGDVVTFIVERDGIEYLEVIDRSLLLDHAFETTTSNKIEVDILLLNSEIRVVADGVTQTTTQAVNESGTYYAYADRDADILYAGLNYDVLIKSLPVALETQSEGNIVNQLRRITKCVVNMYESRGVYLNGQLITNRKFGDPTDEPLTPITGIKSTYLLGYNIKAQVEITQNNPEPLTILALDLEVSY